MLLNLMRRIMFVTCVIVSNALAQSPITLTVNTQSSGIRIPDDFSGLSVEMGCLKSGNAGTTGNMFDDTTQWPQVFHSQVMTLFRELGIKHIRVGGGSVDMGIAPTNYDIDAFFRFVKMMNLRVTYSVRLLNGNITDDTTIVKYIWNNDSQYVDCFSIGNEPDWNSYHNQDPAIKDYPTYLSQWRSFATAITTAVPSVKFGGPDTGSNYPVPGAKSTNYLGFSWTYLFANDEKNSGIVKSIYLHNYVGQSASGTAQGMIDAMLSSAWVTSYYSALYNSTCVPVSQMGFPFRLTESNSFSGYLQGGSNSFATALFALDYMHWWAEHGAAGVNFHNKQWVGNGPIYLDANKNYQVYPVGYGIKAFDLGGHGVVDSLAITNTDTLNLTAYAVQDTHSLYVTIINKEHGAGARNAIVKIAAAGFGDSAAVVYLTVPDGNVADTSGVLLGGAPITNSGTWQGTWSSIDSIKANEYFVTVPASAAAIVKIDSPVTSVSEGQSIPSEFILSQNYPNPFNPMTVINYTIPHSSFITLKVYNILGEKVATLYQGYQKAGSYNFSFDASALSSGVYLYRLQANGFSETKKMILMK